MVRSAVRGVVAVAILLALAAQSFGQTIEGADPAPFVSASNLHRVFLQPGDGALERLVDARAVLRLEDYGSFAMAVVDERALGGRFAFLAAGFDIRDNEAVVGFSEAGIDATDAETIARSQRIIPEELLSTGELASDLMIVHFAGPVRDEWLARLETTGARLVSYMASNAYIVAVDRGARRELETFRADPAVNWIGFYHPYYRISPDLRTDAVLGQGLRSVTVQVIDGIDAEPVITALLSGEFTIERATTHVLNFTNVNVLLPGSLIPALAAHPAVFAVESRSPEKMLDEAQGQIMAGNLNVAGTAPSGVGYFTWLGTKGFAQTGQFAFAVDVTDDGIDRGSLTDVNTEFKVGGLASGAGRVVYNHNYTSDALADGGGGHGNLNASVVGGYNTLTGSANEDASGYNYGLGLCPFVNLGNTKVFSNGSGSTFTAGTTTRLAAAYNGGARISSNSWGYTTGNGYNSDSQAHDTVVRDALSATMGNQELTVVFAAGNDGSGANTVRPPATAKNIICVGASENFRQTGTDGCGIGNTGADNAKDIISFSSRGPCSDGRKKPDIQAPGTHIQGAASRSTSYNGAGVCNQYWPAGQTAYAWSSGTSHSTPAISGASALVRQYFINQAFGTPSPAMVKAALMTTTTHMTGVGANDTLPSNNQGMGRVNLGMTFDASSLVRVDQSQILGATGATYTVSGSVASSAKPFRVGLVWTDKPGATTGNAWVNNLDLSVTVGGVTYKGNVFSGANSISGGTADASNNAEFVFRPAGVSGAFTVTVTATNIAGDGVPGNADTTDQDFALIVYNGSTTATPDFTIASTPTARTINQGTSTTYSVSSTPSGGFAGNVTYSVSGLPAGATASFSPNPAAAGAATTLTVATTTSTPAGTSTLTITGVSGAITRTTTVTLTVNVPNFTLSASPTSRSIARGTSTTYAISSTATGGFTGNVTYSVAGLPTGATGSFSPNPAAVGAVSTLTVTTATTTPAGTYALTVTGVSGALTRTTSVTLTVTVPTFTIAATPASRTVTRGTATTYSITSAASGGFTGNITYSISGMPTGATGSFSPNPVAVGAASTLTVGTATTTPTGTYTLTVTGVSGAQTKTTTVTLIVQAAAGGSTVFRYNVSPALAIPDNNATGVTSSVSVVESQTILSVAVNVNITHTYKGDLKVTLVSPAGTQIILHNLTGGATDNIVTGYSIITTPNQALTGLLGQNSAGTWQLKVADLAAADIGTLNSWNLVINGFKTVTTNLAIPDNNATGVTSSMTYTPTGTVTSVKVRVNITHTYKGDLKVTLISPAGTQVILHNLTGGATDNINTEYPDLTASNQSLAAFNGQAIAGAWKLKVQDLAAADTGTLVSWQLSFNQ